MHLIDIIRTNCSPFFSLVAMPFRRVVFPFRPRPVGYGFCYIPSSSGVHDLEVDIWKPCGAPLEELMDFHLGGGPALVDTDVIQSINKAKEDRCHLFTQSAGTVRVHMEVTLRNFHLHHVSSGSGDPRAHQRE